MPIQFTCAKCGKRLRAPDDMAGKQSRCPECQTVQQVPEDIVDAEMAGSAPPAPPPLEPLERIQDLPPAEPRRDAGRRRAFDPDEDEEREPCPVCGEMIRPNAAKCRFCGEIFDESLRQEEKRKRGKDVDRDMTTGDWVLAVLCSAIGCIVGIVWAVQGKPKAGKMIGVSLLFVVIWNIVRFAIEAALQPRRF